MSLSVYLSLSETCGVLETGHLPRWNDVRGYADGVPSAGPDDCAKKCTHVLGCAAWTLHKTTNNCWLKTIKTGIVFSNDWVSGEPCINMESTNPIGSDDNYSDLTSTKFNNFFVDEQEVMKVVMMATMLSKARNLGNLRHR